MTNRESESSGNGALRDELKRYFGLIEDDLRRLREAEQVVLRCDECIRGNEFLGTAPDKFLRVLSELFVAELNMAIDRVRSEDRNDASLDEILRKLIAFPDALPDRHEFVGRYPEPIRQVGNEVFDELVGRGLERLPREEIAADRATLKSVTSHVHNFARQRLRHRDKHIDHTMWPSGQALRTLESVFEIGSRYARLLDVSLECRPPHDDSWEQVLRLPFDPNAAGLVAGMVWALADAGVKVVNGHSLIEIVRYLGLPDTDELPRRDP